MSNMKAFCFSLLIIGLYSTTFVRGGNFNFKKARSDLVSIMNNISGKLSDSPDFNYAAVDSAIASNNIQGFINAANGLLNSTQKNELLNLHPNTRYYLKEDIATYMGQFNEVVRKASINAKNYEAPFTELWRSLRDSL